MERTTINDLPDELLVEILSSLPLSEKTIPTSILSKRWRDLWKLVPQLMFDDKSFDKRVSFMNFVRRSLKFNNNQALESLHLKLHRDYCDSEMNVLVQAAVDRSVRELGLELFDGTLVLPSCLTTCKTLDTLKLFRVGIHSHHLLRLPYLKSLSLISVMFERNKYFASLLQICPVLEYLVVCNCKVFNGGVLSSTWKTLKTLELKQLSIKLFPVFLHLPSLNVLQLSSVEFLGDESLKRLLRGCPVLECLVINRTRKDNVLVYNIDVPTLRTLSITSSIKEEKETHGFLIKTPSLTELSFEVSTSLFTIFVGPMPKVTKANIEVFCDQSENILASLTSVRHLSLCSPTSMTAYPEGTSISSLKHLELCTCSDGWWILLLCMLNGAPKVQSLKLKSKHTATHNGVMNLWRKPKVVPKCLSEHLEILEWRQYEDKELENSVAEYILANATCLKMATFSTRYRSHRIEMKLNSMHRVSKTCQLVVD